ncbi:hypothetical protein TI03_05195 [Achromatium sp. WMS1]|nr:hypothetical protein TI03_05195 [Achromatium sp. WMS1]
MKIQMGFLLFCLAQQVFAENNMFETYFVGKYLLVGKGIDTNRTYTGQVEIFLEHKKLRLKRIIDGLVVFGDAIIEPALGGDANVLRFRYMQSGTHD